MQSLYQPVNHNLLNPFTVREPSRAESTMTRRCSHCSNNGHNSRTCPTRGGGVRLTDGSIMKKSASMGNLPALYHSSSPAAVSPNPSSPASSDPIEGYLSDDPAHASCSAKRRADCKKGTPWTEEEHRLFLFGLQKLGKGGWRGIARNYVLSRTPTQVASHAQKYFIRQCSATRRKRRSSLFDMAAESPEDHFMLPPAAVLSKEPMNLDELVGMSKQLSLKDPEHVHNIKPSPLSLKLLAEPSRQSAFHASTPAPV
ncbi:hypothetical protein L1987_67097 [Smallanthus sonchifolius]|uniref:Uncharacterized protein n=1 Tax=Smallanthus sonchifolius TaxID=185202 RepID=A0ACB9BZB0_9ASTR|nr:hypothetical protein L1987_67097 [Smallanthus sonchifolius]